MRMFAVLTALLVVGGTLIVLYFPGSFSLGAWYTALILLLFAELGRRMVKQETRADAVR